MRSMSSACCSPDEVIFGSDFSQSLYCHFLCGLLQRDQITLISSTFAHSIVHSFRTFESLWEDLEADIRSGHVSAARVPSPAVRAAVSRLVPGPDPALADLVRKICSGLSNWYGLVPELFPNVKYIYGIMTGSMEPYLKTLRHYAGDVPLVTADYGSSEGWVGANVDPTMPPEMATYAVLPNIGYFEFIPLTGDATPLGLTEVKVGEEYEILVTNYAGMLLLCSSFYFIIKIRDKDMICTFANHVIHEFWGTRVSMS
jgi:jasmonic acid-amino synthetase